jgi:hypothetical protein
MLTALRTGVVIVGFALTLVVAGCSDGSAGAADSPGRPESTGRPVSTGHPVSTAVATPGPAATGATGAPSVAISLAPAVKIGTTAKLRDGVRVGIGKIRAVTVKAQQPGEVAGPAASVPVTVTNGSDQPFSLGGMVVTVSYGKGTPGNQTTSGPSKPLTGSLAPGELARGSYVFMVPRKNVANLRVQVSSDESPIIAEFEH